MATTKKKMVGRNGSAKTVRELKKELTALKKQLHQERQFNKKLARRVLPLCPKALEDQIPSIDEIKRLADTQPSLLDLIDSLR